MTRETSLPIRGADLPASTVFHVEVGRSEGKWAGQCREIDVFALMPTPELLELAIRLQIFRALTDPPASPLELAVALTDRL